MAAALEVVNIHKSFSKKPVLKGVSFNLEPGSFNGLIGPSGAGKSVLLKIIGGVSRANSGEIRNKPDNLSLMFQEGALFDSLTVFDNIAFPLVGGKVPAANLARAKKREVTEKVSIALARVGLTKAAYKMPAQISGGMRRRVSLARALVSKPELMLLDDPTSGLDPVASSVIMNLIVEMHREYRPTILTVSQDLRRLLPVAEKIFGLFDGRICFGGTLDELKSSDHSLLRTFASCRYDLAA